MSYDNRNESICFQYAMAHAMKYYIHNSGGSKIDIKDVISLAKRIALVSMNPNLEQELAKIEQQRKDHKGV